LLTLKDWNTDMISEVLELAGKVKKNPENYHNVMSRKTLVMIFEKPSLRTRVSFETGMTRMGGHAIYYDTSTSPMGAGKESISDTAGCLSRYADIVMARMFEHKHIEELAEHSSIPVINALTNFSHPCQILADLQTIQEKKGSLKGLKLTYMGDSNNNVTHSLMYGCAFMGMNVSVGCPEGAEYSPEPQVLKESSAIAEKLGAKVEVHHDAATAAKDADVVYTDSWMSYHIPPEQSEARVKVFTPYQVNTELMKNAKSDAIFMNCLPAARGCEQTAEVIDGPQSVVFDEAENRLHAQNAVMIKLMENCG